MRAISASSNLNKILTPSSTTKSNGFVASLPRNKPMISQRKLTWRWFRTVNSLISRSGWEASLPHSTKLTKTHTVSTHGLIIYRFQCHCRKKNTRKSRGKEVRLMKTIGLWGMKCARQSPSPWSSIGKRWNKSIRPWRVSKSQTGAWNFTWSRTTVCSSFMKSSTAL